MSESSPLSASNGSGSTIRTLAVRLTDDLRAQLDVIAALNERSVTEEIRIALEAWIDRSKTDPTLAARADIVRAEIEREAEIKRGAIAAIFAAKSPVVNRGAKRAEASS